MPIEKVGYRRLYDSLGCSLSEQNEFTYSFYVNGLETVVYIGPKPKRGLVINSNIGKYIYPNGISPVGKFEYHKDATKSGYSRNFFTEIQCIKQIEVDAELSSAFQNKDTNAHDTLLRLASKDHKLFSETVNLVAGIIGLRFHRQFVLEVINENYFAIRDENDWVFNITGEWLENLDSISLNKLGRDGLSNILGGLRDSPAKAREIGTSIFSWLLRAWKERDPISKFVALFIPLEIILAGYGSNDLDQIEKEKRAGYEKIREIVSKHTEQDEKNLVKLCDELVTRQRPSLNSRFEQLAKEANLENSTKHVIAFKRFNAIRNQLLHHGNSQIQLEVPIKIDDIEQDTQQLEDLVERYVCWTLFRDQIIYPSSFRK